MATFEKAYKHLAQAEGGWTNIPNETAFGIDRKHWPKWEGWRTVDHVIANSPGGMTLRQLRDYMTRTLRAKPEFMAQVKEFFRANFWTRNYEKIEDQRSANYLFDKAVLCGPIQAHKIAQRAIGVKADGAVGPVTLKTINIYSGDLFVKIVDVYFDQFFHHLAQANSEMEQYEQGWVNRG